MVGDGQTQRRDRETENLNPRGGRWGGESEDQSPEESVHQEWFKSPYGVNWQTGRDNDDSAGSVEGVERMDQFVLNG